MPSEFQTGFVVREPAWHQLAAVLDEPQTAAEALVAAGQDWLVKKAPIEAFIEGARIPMPRFFATYRDDSGAPLGIVGKDWTPVQNAEAFQFMDELVGGGELRYESCGVLQGGRKVYMLAAHPDYMVLPAGEEIKRFILCWNGHAGTLAFGLKRVNMRVVCANTLGAAMRESGSAWQARHTSGIAYRGALQARQILGLSFSHDERFELMATRLIETKMDPSDERQFVRRLIPLSPNVEPDSRAAKNAHEARAAVLAIMRQGADLENVRGTAWAALQAATEYADWHTIVRGGGRTASEARFTRSWIREDPIKVRALAELAPWYTG